MDSSAQFKHPKAPSFMIAGAQKSGTTTLHHLLQAHPDVYFPKTPQEIHFFDNDTAYERGIDWYLDLFLGANIDQTTGQTSPLYLYFEKAAYRIKKHLPATKIIVILRHPVERAYSHYWNSVRYGYETLPFEKAIAMESARIQKGDLERRNFSYVDRGRYTRQLALYQELFSLKNLLVITQDDLKADPLAALTLCCKFIGVDSNYFAQNTLSKATHNASRLPRLKRLQTLRPILEKQNLHTVIRALDKLNLKEENYQPMSNATRAWLKNTFSEEIHLLKEWVALNTESKIKWN